MSQVQRQPDESNDSYVASHDTFFEDSIVREVKMLEIRACVLLRHSQLAPDDRSSW